MNNKESDTFTEIPADKKRVQLKAEDDLLDISQDPIFKAVLTQDTPASRNALRFLVSAAIGQPVTIISVSTNEPPVRGIRDRQLRYDISVKFNDGSLGDIEMTVYPDVYEHFRQEYYLARLFTTQDIKGTELGYSNLKPTWQISLLGENIHADNALVHQFRYYDKENNLPFRGLTSIIDWKVGWNPASTINFLSNEEPGSLLQGSSCGTAKGGTVPGKAGLRDGAYRALGSIFPV
ncbi:hypothetical protein TREPR_1293 [Treponema primitia ZAS-2]|uniref:Uncharacterized protein n=1 Tax=Treponema primitia (strain ATCC BAA-887 / DSM 12427 / ZAS-2) TaxID=545694 RepID=F5YRE0_TREPZ|nr:PD-(D/E)XK nuclease family transposase [Treponema primitia]AEF83728.1 hypothetical protein TREPR_1293 [Treponema primitia ZAS-2]